MRVNNHVLRAARGRAFKEKIAEYINSIKEENLNEISEITPSEAHSKFEEFVVSTAQGVAEREVKNRPDWFTQSEEILLQHINLRNKAHKVYLRSGNKQAHH